MILLAQSRGGLLTTAASTTGLRLGYPPAAPVCMPDRSSVYRRSSGLSSS